jgi:hypothetical protein
MDSRSKSGPELPHKVHGFREPVKACCLELAVNAIRSVAAIALAGCALSVLAACGSDLTTVAGVVSAAASAVGNRDQASLFPLIDERARFALGATHQARQRAAALVRETYPEPERTTALTELGDAAIADSVSDLFARRCADPCLAALARTLGAPREVEVDGPLTRVTTVRDTELTLYQAKDGRYGIVWETEALARERTRAAAELDVIAKTAVAYRAQRALSGT